MQIFLYRGGRRPDLLLPQQTVIPAVLEDVQEHNNYRLCDFMGCDDDGGCKLDESSVFVCNPYSRRSVVVEQTAKQFIYLKKVEGRRQ